MIPKKFALSYQCASGGGRGIANGVCDRAAGVQHVCAPVKITHRSSDDAYITESNMAWIWGVMAAEVRIISGLVCTMVGPLLSNTARKHIRRM